MLQMMTSKQLNEWMAFATMEPVGEPVPPDPEEMKKKKQQQQRANFEGGMRALMQKRQT